MRDPTRVQVEQTIGRKTHRYSLSTVLQVLQGLKKFRNLPQTLETRLRRGDRIQSLPGISYQVIPEHREP